MVRGEKFTPPNYKAGIALITVSKLSNNVASSVRVHQTFASSGKEDYVIARSYWESSDGWSIDDLDKTVFSGDTGEEDVVVDSAISIENVVGESACGHAEIR